MLSDLGTKPRSVGHDTQTSDWAENASAPDNQSCQWTITVMINMIIPRTLHHLENFKIAAGHLLRRNTGQLCETCWLQTIAFRSNLYKCLRNSEVYDTHNANNSFQLLMSRTAEAAFKLCTTRWMSMHHHHNGLLHFWKSRMAALKVDLAEIESPLSRALGSIEGHSRFACWCGVVHTDTQSPKHLGFLRWARNERGERLWLFASSGSGERKWSVIESCTTCVVVSVLLLQKTVPVDLHWIGFNRCSLRCKRRPKCRVTGCRFSR